MPAVFLTPDDLEPINKALADLLTQVQAANATALAAGTGAAAAAGAAAEASAAAAAATARAGALEQLAKAPRAQQIASFDWFNFPGDVGAPKLISPTETTVGLTFTTSTHIAPQVDDQKLARPDRLAIDLVTLGKGSVDFKLYAWSAEQAVNAAQFASTPTLALIKTVTMATDIDQHRYHRYFSLSQDEIDALMAVPTKYGLVFGLRYVAQSASLMSALKASLIAAYQR